MRAGIPKEIAAGETRVAATPEAVKKLCGHGFEVCVERTAGQASSYRDEDYESAGAAVVDAEAALQSDLVLKVRAPVAGEIKSFKSGAVLIALLEPYAADNGLDQLASAGVDALAMELIPRISRAQSMDALSSQANIAGYRAVIEACRLYPRFFPMMMTAAGAARPPKVVVLGAGVAGLQAIATARRLGAVVESFDVRPEVKEQVESLGAKFIELDIGETGAGSGGYAKELSEDAKQRQQAALTEYLQSANVIITTALIPGRPAPTLITEEAVKGMKEGSVIVDLAAANGGNCPLSVADEVVVEHGVTIVGHTNFPAMVAADASAFYARNVFNLVAAMVEKSGDELMFKNFADDEITQSAQVVAAGKVVYQRPG